VQTQVFINMVSGLPRIRKNRIKNFQEDSSADCSAFCYASCPAHRDRCKIADTGVGYATEFCMMVCKCM